LVSQSSGEDVQNRIYGKKKRDKKGGEDKKIPTEKKLYYPAGLHICGSDVGSQEIEKKEEMAIPRVRACRTRDSDRQSCLGKRMVAP